MFKFDFDIEDTADEIDFVIPESETELSPLTAAPADTQALKSLPYAEHQLADLIDALPPLISYSEIAIPLSSGREFRLARRDLFDARFQLISEGYEIADPSAGGGEAEVKDEERKKALGFMEDPSDLVPGVYEGGLKTWECSLDLVDYLDGLEYTGTGKRIIEIGCGTAVPSLFLLHKVFSETSRKEDTYLHLQDYNPSVLELVTLPNIILAWYLSSASLPFRDSQTPPSSPPKPKIVSLSNPIESTLEFTPSLKAAFLQTLSDQNVQLKFTSGSWASTSLDDTPPFDLVLTSETIYNPDNLPSLVHLMQEACVPYSPPVLSSTTPAEKRATTEVDVLAEGLEVRLHTRESGDGLCLVAAKVLYFGVGGGVPDFVKRIEEDGGAQVETVWERKQGVGRCVMSVRW